MVYITSPKAISFALFHPIEQLMLQGWTAIHATIEFVEQGSDEDKAYRGSDHEMDYDDIKFHLPPCPDDVVPGQWLSE